MFSEVGLLFSEVEVDFLIFIFSFSFLFGLKCGNLDAWLTGFLWLYLFGLLFYDLLQFLSNLLINLLLINCELFGCWLLYCFDFSDWLYLGWSCFFSCLFCWSLFLFLLIAIGGLCQTELFQCLFKLGQLVFLLLLFLLFGLLLLGDWLFGDRLSFLLSLFFLFAFIISHIEGVSDGIELESFLFEFLRLESTFDGFHVTETTSEMFFRIEGLDSWLLFILFGIRLSFLIGFVIIVGGGFLFLMIRLLFFRF